MVTNYITSIHVLINGGFRHQNKLVTQKQRIPSKDAAGNSIRDVGGNDVFVERDVRRRLIATQPLPTNSDKLLALHPFPNPTFP